MTLLHQDEYLIQETLENIAQIFETAAAWDPNTSSLKDLKDSMALLMYLATHNIRDVRGTAAENEWLERALYRSHGLSFTIDKAKLFDLDAFENPLLSDFRKVHDERVRLDSPSGST